MNARTTTSSPMAERPLDRTYRKGSMKPDVTEEEREKARELRQKGMTLEAIAQELGRVKSTVYWMLKGRP